MKTSIILAISLMMGISSVTYAGNDAQTRSMVSAATTIEYNTNLLVRSEVASRLKSSSSTMLKARYSAAVELYNQANEAFESGNEIAAQELANDSIRTIAASVPMLYIPNQMAMAE